MIQLLGSRSTGPVSLVVLESLQGIDEEGERVVCEGSSFGGATGGAIVGATFGAFKDCREIEVNLGITGNDSQDQNTIRFEVKDFSGWRASSEISILLQNNVP